MLMVNGNPATIRQNIIQKKMIGERTLILSRLWFFSVSLSVTTEFVSL